MLEVPSDEKPLGEEYSRLPKLVIGLMDPMANSGFACLEEGFSSGTFMGG